MKVDGPKGFNFKLNNNYKDYTNGAREYLGYRLHREFTGVGCQTAIGEVYFNGEYYGQYAVVEDLNKSFFERALGGVTTRIKSSHTATGILNDRIDSDLKWYGESEVPYSGRYQLKQGQLRDFVSVIDIINNRPKEAYRYLDIEQICKFLAVENYITNKDGIIGNLFSHNYEVVQRASDGKWQIVPWDLNLAFGALALADRQGNYPTRQELASMPIDAGVEKNALVAMIMDRFKTLYVHHYLELLKQYPSSVLVDWVSEFQHMTSESRTRDSKLIPAEKVNKSFTEDIYEIDGYAPGLIPFIEERYTFLENLKLDEAYPDIITSVVLDGERVDITLQSDPGRSPVFVEYTKDDGQRKRIKAVSTGVSFQFSCTLPKEARKYFAFVVIEGIKYPFPYNGQVSPMPVE